MDDRVAARHCRGRADRQRHGHSFGELVTVFPEGHVGVDDSQVMLLRVRPGLLTERTVERGAVDGWVAYSKICTHAGCSVGLFGIDDREPDTVRQLVCPCHQSIFDPVDSARPTGGPATRSLPQLASRDRRRRVPRRPGDFDRPRRPDRLERGMSDHDDTGQRHSGAASSSATSTRCTSRVGGGSMVSKVLHKVFPNHFSFLWGELALYSFVVL